ncbi:MAG: DNA photolyase family protein [Ignavibacteria bacterium]|nr:DNA photolyase family protein [Ignavibacteria bacterium]
MEKINIAWFRRDLRISDNPVLNYTSELPLLPIFIFDKDILKNLPTTDRRITFIFDQVISLKNELAKFNSNLAIFYGKPIDIFNYLSQNHYINSIFASTDNDPYSKARDNEISKSYNLILIFDNFLVNPEDVKTNEGTTYKIFSHYKNSVKGLIEKLKYYHRLQIPNKINTPNYNGFEVLTEIDNGKIIVKPLTIESLGFERQKIIFEGAIKSPKKLLEEFSTTVNNYQELRNFPSLRGTSLLSTHLRFGTISIRELVSWAYKQNANSFIDELIWREFFNYILFHYPETTYENFQKNIIVNWQNNPVYFERWKNAETGIPLVDAGIRELTQTGFMHNRIRMVVASFLTKNLLIDWKLGEEFFSRYLFDYETSSNIGNWQWVAGVGTDPRSAYRIFNPFLQSKKFDPNCDYIFKFVPELRKISPQQIHNPEYILNNKILGYSTPIIKDIRMANMNFYLSYLKFKKEK